MDPVAARPHGTRDRWRDALAIYLHKRVIGMAFLGFSAGLPFLLVFSTLSAWLRDVDVSLTTIGFFSFIGLTYSLKFFWAPVIDRTPVPVLTRLFGRRRSWMLIGILGVAAGLLGMASTDPSEDLVRMAMFALLVAFSSATQDIVVDAYRIEAAEKLLQGGMAATYQTGYRIAIAITGGAAIGMREYMDWSLIYAMMAVLTVIGLTTVLFIREPEPKHSAAVAEREERVIQFIERNGHLPIWARDAGAWVVGAIVCPFVDFFSRNGMIALTILAFIGLFRVSDVLMGAMANPFYIDAGFTFLQIGTIVKLYGTVATIVGAFVGGVLVARFGIFKPLLLGAILLPLTNLLFAGLDVIGPETWMLYVTISADNLSVGLSGTAFIAYLSSLTSTAYTATQYALFTSLMTLPGKLFAGFSGIVVDATGYFDFFVFTAIAGIPAVLLVMYLMRRERRLAANDAA